ncbi:hypothetical protein EYF80_005463 [Liparis tanakae]|uniref:Uncharacterized protein n=1 Tax=Liparis tanakae TaxID=230148 RepID=A0A4Z2J1S4_9TELE|nr:hypothetical protein EYF80_005463 [Liparis tanakae]
MVKANTTWHMSQPRDGSLGLRRREEEEEEEEEGRLEVKTVGVEKGGRRHSGRRGGSAKERSPQGSS